MKKINITSFGHENFKKKPPHIDLQIFLKKYLNNIGINVVLNKPLSKKYFNLLFEGIRYNYVNKIKKFQKEGISIGFINTEFLVGEENLELKYFTHDNFFLLNRYINKKSNKFLLRFIFIFYKFNEFILRKMLNKKDANMHKNYKFFENPIKRIMYEFSKSNYFTNNKNVSLFNYFFRKLVHWKTQTHDYINLIARSKLIISLGLENPYQKKIAKKYKIPYIFIPGIYIKNYFTNEKKYKKKYDFFFSGTLNAYREELINELKKKYTIFYSNRNLTYNERLKYMLSSKYVLDLRLKKSATMLSFNRIISSLNLGVPIICEAKKNFIPRYLDKYIYKYERNKIYDNIAFFIKNENKIKKNFNIKRKHYINNFSNFYQNKYKEIFKQLII